MYKYIRIYKYVCQRVFNKIKFISTYYIIMFMKRMIIVIELWRCGCLVLLFFCIIIKNIDKITICFCISQSYIFSILLLHLIENKEKKIINVNK